MKVSRCLDRVLLFFPIGSYSLTLIHISVTFGKSLIKLGHIFLIYKIGYFSRFRFVFFFPGFEVN